VQIESFITNISTLTTLNALDSAAGHVLNRAIKYSIASGSFKENTRTPPCART